MSAAATWTSTTSIPSSRRGSGTAGSATGGPAWSPSAPGSGAGWSAPRPLHPTQVPPRSRSSGSRALTSPPGDRRQRPSMNSTGSRLATTTSWESPEWISVAGSAMGAFSPVEGHAGGTPTSAVVSGSPAHGSRAAPAACPSGHHRRRSHQPHRGPGLGGSTASTRGSGATGAARPPAAARAASGSPPPSPRHAAPAAAASAPMSSARRRCRASAASSCSHATLAPLDTWCSSTRWQGRLEHAGGAHRVDRQRQRPTHVVGPRHPPTRLVVDHHELLTTCGIGAQVKPVDAARQRQHRRGRADGPLQPDRLGRRVQTGQVVGHHVHRAGAPPQRLVPVPVAVLDPAAVDQVAGSVGRAPLRGQRPPVPQGAVDGDPPGGMRPGPARGPLLQVAQAEPPRAVQPRGQQRRRRGEQPHRHGPLPTQDPALAGRLTQASRLTLAGRPARSPGHGRDASPPGRRGP